MIEVSLAISDAQLERLEEFFCEQLQSNWLLFRVRPSEPAFLKGYFEDEPSIIAALKELKSECEDLRIDGYELNEIQDQDWKMAYRHHLRAWKYGRLNWIPEWEREDTVEEPEEVYVYLDSGMAFGTGSHETTRLCAEALVDFCERNPERIEDLKLIDAGCGSGVLAMSAKHLGFGEVYAFDRDPEAVKVTDANLRFNGFEDEVELKEAGLEEGLESRRADIILANIQADVLSIYADEIVAAWNPEGLMVLSGILAIEYKSVEKTFLASLKKMSGVGPWNSEMVQKGEWVSLSFSRK